MRKWTIHEEREFILMDLWSCAWNRSKPSSEAIDETLEALYKLYKEERDEIYSIRNTYNCFIYWM